jgi:hypothetical protein
MRFAIPLRFGLIGAVLLAESAHPQDADDSLVPYAVHIDRTPKQTTWTGHGVYLGRGIVITAAHVAGLGFWRRPRVEVDGQDFPTKVVKDGHFHSVDLTLLSVDEQQLPVSLQPRHMRLCQKAPRVGEQVIVATPEGVARSHVMSHYWLPHPVPAKFQSVIAYVEQTGASGSGVFDADEKCLLGIISGKIWDDQIKEENGRRVAERHDVAKYFVPASTIADFMPPEVRALLRSD